MLVNSQSCKVH